jgi:hypothetical protein
MVAAEEVGVHDRQGDARSADVVGHLWEGPRALGSTRRHGHKQGALTMTVEKRSLIATVATKS